MIDAMVVLTTLPNAEAASKLSKTLVDERLAACANILPAIRSVYRWQGKVQEEAEVLVLLKTRQERFGRLKARVLELHPYDVPEVIAIRIDDGHQPYLDWVTDATEEKK